MEICRHRISLWFLQLFGSCHLCRECEEFLHRSSRHHVRVRRTQQQCCVVVATLCTCFFIPNHSYTSMHVPVPTMENRIGRRRRGAEFCRSHLVNSVYYYCLCIHYGCCLHLGICSRHLQEQPIGRQHLFCDYDYPSCGHYIVVLWFVVSVYEIKKLTFVRWNEKEKKHG